MFVVVANRGSKMKKRMHRQSKMIGIVKVLKDWGDHADRILAGIPFRLLSISFASRVSKGNRSLSLPCSSMMLGLNR
jgi:hypothetical protein